MSNAGFYIWSVEHNAWWRPHERGYTQSVAEAGVYHEARAKEIVKSANIVSFNECMIPVHCVKEGGSA